MGDTAADERVQQLLHAVDSLANVGRWDSAPATGVVHWSDNLFRIHGLENVYQRLGVTDKTSAVAEAMRLGLID